jgi:hypothetical protein
MVRELEHGDGTGVEAMTANEHLMSRLKASYLGMYRDEDQKDEKIAAA